MDLVLTGQQMIYLCIDLRWESDKDVYSPHISFYVSVHMRVRVHTYVPQRVHVCPSLVQCISIMRHMPPCVMVSRAVSGYCDCHIYRREGKGIFPV